MKTHQYKEWVIDTFDQASPTYGDKECSFFNYFGERLAQQSGLKASDKVLDVATGKGAVLIPASKIAKDVTGIDLSLGMIRELKKRIRPGVEILKMDAEDLTFPDRSFDVVFCAFALFFFPNLAGALSEFKRVLKPGGRLAVSIWGKKSPLEAWLAERMKELGAVRKLMVIDLDNGELLKEALSGFAEVEIREESKLFGYESGIDWWNSLWARGSRSLLDQLSAENLEQLKNEALLRFQDQNGQVRQVFYGLAR